MRPMRPTYKCSGKMPFYLLTPKKNIYASHQIKFSSIFVEVFIFFFISSGGAFQSSFEDVATVDIVFSVRDTNACVVPFESKPRI